MNLVEPIATTHRSPDEPEVLVQVDRVGKILCRDLKSSLRYGVIDVMRDAAPFLRREVDVDGEPPLRPAEFWANRGISFTLRRGECLGLIGHNGAGKTTLLKMLHGLIKPDSGRIELHGRVGALIALGAGFNPILSGRENIYVNAAVLGLTKAETDSKIDEIIEFADIGEFIDSPVQSYSSGMQVRLGFSVATALDPDVLLLDEVLAVGDMSFRAKCFARIARILETAAVIFVSHNEAQVSRICDKALLLKSGRPIFYGNTSEALKLYRGMQGSRKRQSTVFKHPRVEDVSVLRSCDVVRWGGYLELQVVLRISDDLTAGFILLHWGRDGEFVAYSEVRYAGTEARRLNAGRQLLNITVGPVQLTEGEYELSLSIFDASRKITVVHALDLIAINVVGPVGSGRGGPANLLPMEIAIGPAGP